MFGFYQYSLDTDQILSIQSRYTYFIQFRSDFINTVLIFYQYRLDIHILPMATDHKELHQ